MAWPLTMFGIIGFSAISSRLSMCRKVHSLCHPTEPGSREHFCRPPQDACHSVPMLSAILLKSTIYWNELLVSTVAASLAQISIEPLWNILIEVLLICLEITRFISEFYQQELSNSALFKPSKYWTDMISTAFFDMFWCGSISWIWLIVTASLICNGRNSPKLNMPFSCFHEYQHLLVNP